MCGFGHGANRTAWNSWLSAVNGVRVEVVERLDHPVVDRARAARCRPRVSSGAASAVAAPSTRPSVCMREAVLRVVDHRHVRADVALERHEPLGLELADRLAHRHDAHVELFRDRARAPAGSPGVKSWFAMRSLIQA